MKPVYIQAQDVASINPEGAAGYRSVGVELNMTRRQEERAIVEMIGQWPEHEAFEWLKSEFPEWFESATQEPA